MRKGRLDLSEQKYIRDNIKDTGKRLWRFAVLEGGDGQRHNTGQLGR